jgi:hypothetical protein
MNEVLISPVDYCLHHGIVEIVPVRPLRRAPAHWREDRIGRLNAAIWGSSR